MTEEGGHSSFSSSGSQKKKKKIHVVKVTEEADDSFPQAKWDAQQELGADPRMALALQTPRPVTCLRSPFPSRTGSWVW